MEPKGFYVAHRGEAFDAEGNGRFVKDVLSVGKRFHPATKKIIDFPQKRIDGLEYQNNRYLRNGNKMPFPKGHTTDPLANLGKWSGPFLKRAQDLVGVVEVTDPDALSKVQSKTLDGVSVYVEKDVVDPLGNLYPEVCTHICATDYPVWTGQKDFIALSQEVFKKSASDIYVPESLSSEGGTVADPMDLHASHKKLAGELEASSKAYAAAHQTHGAGHAVTKDAAGKMRDAATRLQNHAKIMAQHVHNQTSDYPYAMSRPSVIDAVQALSCRNSIDPKAILRALGVLSRGA